MSEIPAKSLQVNEYGLDGIIEWDSITECATAHAMKPATIKSLIFYGGCLDGFTTFDIPVSCPFDIRENCGKLEIYLPETGEVMDGGTATKVRKRKQRLKLVEDDHDRVRRLQRGSSRKQEKMGNISKVSDCQAAKGSEENQDSEAVGT